MRVGEKKFTAFVRTYVFGNWKLFRHTEQMLEKKFRMLIKYRNVDFRIRNDRLGFL